MLNVDVRDLHALLDSVTDSRGEIDLPKAIELVELCMTHGIRSLNKASREMVEQMKTCEPEALSAMAKFVSATDASGLLVHIAELASGSHADRLKLAVQLSLIMDVARIGLTYSSLEMQSDTLDALKQRLAVDNN